MAVVNVTPDSFSDGGRWLDPDAAIAHGLDLISQGADLLDVGGESTRPGAERPSPAEEWRRVGPVVEALASAGAVVSVDTMRAEVACQAVSAGAGLVNDVSGGLADPAMLAAVAESAVPYVAMHWRGHAARMQARAQYADVVAEVTGELGRRVEAAVAAGIAPERLILDPGFGFAKTAEHNWTLLQALLERPEVFGELPLLIGVSRKRFLGTLLAGPDREASAADRPADQRDDASVALTTLLAQRGVWAVRTHSVRAHRDAIAVVERLVPSRPGRRAANS